MRLWNSKKPGRLTLGRVEATVERTTKCELSLSDLEVLELTGNNMSKQILSLGKNSLSTAVYSAAVVIYRIKMLVFLIFH